MVSVKGNGPEGTLTNQTLIDNGTLITNRSARQGEYCAANDPGVLQKTGYVLEAWEVARTRFAGDSIIKHSEADFYELIKGLVPGMLIALGAVFTTTVLGAAIGSLAGGVGAVPGAAVGFSAGMFFLNWLGLGFLGMFLAERFADIGLKMYTGIKIAWNSKGCGAIEIAAQEMADAIGLFYAALLQGLLMFLGAALAQKTLPASLRLLRESKLFKDSAKLEAWVNRNFAKLYEKHIGKPAPGVLPPIGKTIEEWAFFIEALKLRRPPPNRGMLWSKVGETRARELASKNNLTCLEMLLDETEFLRVYREQFGNTQDATTAQIWKLISEKYARNLEGSVAAFIDDPAVIKAVHDNKPPQFVNEIWEIISVMERSPSISQVRVYDGRPGRSGELIRTLDRNIVLQSYESFLKNGPN